MKVKELVQIEKAGAMYRVIDATINGYMTNPKVIIEADRNIVMSRFSEYELVGFENVSKKIIALYVK
jgi:hypothetical protein